jgi:hypothetical protein
MPSYSSVVKPPKVAILATTTVVAEHLAREMQIKQPLLLSPKCLDKIRGHHLKCLIVDQSAWPIPPKAKVLIYPALQTHLGYIRMVTRFDPKQVVV